MTERTCSLPGCDARHLARGYCRRHYKTHGLTPDEARRHRTRERECEACGRRFANTGQGRTCSLACRDLLRPDYAKSCPVPRSHPSRRVMKAEPTSCLVPVDHPSRRGQLCAWCGRGFDPYRSTQLYCTQRCSEAASARRRRGREHGAFGVYTWAEFVRLVLTAGKRCAYCDAADRGLEPDHVIPLSRGGSNTRANLLPACAPCNGEKSDLTPTEWAAARQARGRVPLRSVFDRSEPRWKHLTLTTPTPRRATTGWAA